MVEATRVWARLQGGWRCKPHRRCRRRCCPHNDAKRHFALLPLRMQAVQQPAQAAAAVSALSPDEWRAFKLVHKEALTKGVSNPTVRGEGEADHQHAHTLTAAAAPASVFVGCSVCC